MSGFDNRSDLPPPHYDWSQHDFDSKVVTATERSMHQSFAPVSGPSHSADEDDYETWSDAKFEAAARAFEARQAKRRMQATPQPGASGSGPGPAPNHASPSGAQYDPSRPQTYQSDRSQTPRPSDYAHPYYSVSPPSAPASAPASATASTPIPPTPMAPPQLAVPPYMQVPPPSTAVSNEHEPLPGGGGGLQRAGSLFRTPSISRNDDHGEQLPAFTDVALPEEMVPHDMAPTGPTSGAAPGPVPQSPPPPHTFSAPSTIPQSPPPPHTFSPPSIPPPPPHSVRAQTGPAYLSPTAPQSPPPPHTFSAPSSPSPALHNVQPPALPPLNASRPRPVSHTSAPASPIHSDPPPAFIPSNSHYPIPEKTNPHTYPHLGNARGMSGPMSVYASANRTTYASPTINFDLETAYGRATSPGLPKGTGASLYSSAVSSTMSGRQLPKPGGGRPRSTLPPPPEPPQWTGVGGQPGTYGGLTQASPYAPQYQQPYQPGGPYAQPLVQQPYYGQNQPPQQGTHWNNQYPSYGLTTPPPGGQGQPASWGTPAAQWPGNGGHYRP